MPSKLVNAASFMFAVLRHHSRVLGVCRYRWELVGHRMASAEEELGFIPPCKRGARSPKEAQEPAVNNMGLQIIFCVNIVFLAAHFKPGSVINTNTHTPL